MLDLQICNWNFFMQKCKLDVNTCTTHVDRCIIRTFILQSYWKHTRGLLHTQKLMDFERKKKDEGEDFFKTETVDAGNMFKFLFIKIVLASEK